jgi:hypothetical protein
MRTAIPADAGYVRDSDICSIDIHLIDLTQLTSSGGAASLACVATNWRQRAQYLAHGARSRDNLRLFRFRCRHDVVALVRGLRDK